MVVFDLDTSQKRALAHARMGQRTTAEAKALIERAARSMGVSTSAFTVAAACRAALETLHHYEMTPAARADHEAFMPELEATEPSAALVDLMRLHEDVTRLSTGASASRTSSRIHRA